MESEEPEELSGENHHLGLESPRTSCCFMSTLPQCLPLVGGRIPNAVPNAVSHSWGSGMRTLECLEILPDEPKAPEVSDLGK